MSNVPDKVNSKYLAHILNKRARESSESQSVEVVSNFVKPLLFHLTMVRAAIEDKSPSFNDLELETLLSEAEHLFHTLQQLQRD